MSDTLKLRLKVGIHEFDAEGPAAEVNARLEIWKDLILNMPPHSVAPRPAYASTMESRGTPLPLAAADSDANEQPKNPYAARVFSDDERRDLLTLRVHPSGESKDADAVLLLVYGYGEMRGMEDVPVTKLTRSITMSGLRGNRIDRLAGEHVRANLITKHGAGKGGKYALTNTGRARAEKLVEELYRTVA